MKGVSIKEKGLMGKDSSVVVAGGRGYKKLKSNVKNTIKIKSNKILKLKS